VIVWFSPSVVVISTVSPAPGTTPLSQFVGVFQSDVPPIQLSVLAADANAGNDATAAKIALARQPFPILRRVERNPKPSRPDFTNGQVLMLVPYYPAVARRQANNPRKSPPFCRL
jgi:hypothetical protein